MPLRFVVTKQTAQGEQIQADVVQWNPVTGVIEHDNFEDMLRIMDQALASSDVRMQDMNLRMLEAYQMDKYFTPDTWQRITAILDVLAGRQSAAQVVQRWHDTQEENDALAEARQAHNLTLDLDDVSEQDELRAMREEAWK